MKPKCFVLMSFEEDRQEVFEHAIYPAAEAAGFDCYRADYAVAPQAIVGNIITSIFKDEVIIAVIGFASKVLLIHTGLQPGGKAVTCWETVETVSIMKAGKTVETVFDHTFVSSTGLKPGVNEKDF